MPTDGRRKKILVAVRDAIKSATGADYFNDYSEAGVCELGPEIISSALEGGPRHVLRVRDGVDLHNLQIGPDRTAELEVVVEVLVRDHTPSLVERLSDVLADLTLVIGRNIGLGGTCTTFTLKQIDEPDYTLETAHAAVRIRATYDYMAGVDR